MKQIQLTDEEINALAGLILSVNFKQTGAQSLKNAAVLLARLEEAEEVKEEKPSKKQIKSV